MYTIKEASARTGVTIPVLRAWQRRYGIVDPTRTASGYRLYDEDAILRLRAMRRLVEEGWTPSAAAASLRDADAERVTALAFAPQAAEAREPRDTRDPRGSSVTDMELIDRFVAAAGRLDAAGVEGSLDEMLARGSFEVVAERHLMPALGALGEAWASGSIDVAAEHAASHAVMRRLAAAYQAAGRPGELDQVLVGLPPGSRHELGALAFSVAARRAGLGVLYLGPDLPVRDWTEAATQLGADAAVVGVVTADDRDQAQRVGRALVHAQPRMIVAFGGGAADQALLEAVREAILLPRSIPDAVDALRARLG